MPRSWVNREFRLPAGVCWLAAATVLLLIRNWIISRHSLPLGALGDPQVVLANKLQGWLHIGNVQGRWSGVAWSAGLIWEWVPAILFGLGLWRAIHAPRACAFQPGGRWLFGPWVPATLVLIVSSLISWVAFDGIPHVQDSIAQQFQAKVFASGRLWAPVPPEGWLLRSEYMVQHEGRWFAQYPPGHAALLALGTLIGAPWLICPMLGSASAMLLHGIGKRLYGLRIAGLATWMFCLSPFVWFMSGERMNHVSTLFWVLIALRMLVPTLRRRPELPSTVALATAGLALGLAGSTRPLCGAAWLLMGLLALAATWRSRLGREGDTRSWLTGMTAFALGIGVGLAPMLAFNAATTGSAWMSGYELQWGSTGWGFGQAQWGPPHTLGRGILAAWANWDALGKYLFEWPVPSTLLLAGCVSLPRWGRADRFLIGILAGLTVAHVPYFFQDLCLGPRFLYAALPAILLLSARGALAGGIWLGQGQALGMWPVVRRIPPGLVIMSLVGIAVNGPALWQWYACDFWGTSTRLVREVEERGIQNAVVFIRDRGRLRCEELRRRGFSLSLAQAAVDALDPAWVDLQMDAAERDKLAGDQLTKSVREALADPSRLHYRRIPPWMEPGGFSTNVNFGFWANGPDPGTQKVIYALHPAERLEEILPAFGDRVVWSYDWDRATRRFTLREIERGPAATTRGR